MSLSTVCQYNTTFKAQVVHKVDIWAELTVACICDHGDQDTSEAHKTEPAPVLSQATGVAVGWGPALPECWSAQSWPHQEAPRRLAQLNLRRSP